jgi:tripartite-type tricarboxylate transporter receptor subunit TctC
MRIARLLAAALALLTLGLVPAFAQGYPNRTVKIIVAFTPGSSTDILARLVADQLSKSLGQPFVVENRAGAGGIIGTEFASKAAPDGYTLTTAPSGPFGINPAIYAKLPYDPEKDFEPIANIGFTPQVLVVGPSAKFRTLKELVAAAKANPGAIDYGTLGKGTTSHLGMEHFQAVAGIKLNHIPFKGGSEAQTQVMGGNIPMMSDAVPGVMPAVRGGRLTALGIASAQRSPFAPDVPTLAELGYPVEAVGWIGLAAPAKTPVAILDKLNAEINRMMSEPAMKERFNALSFVSAVGTRAEFAAFIRDEIAKWKRVAKDSGVKAD